MKKFFFFLSAIALLGLTSACVEQLSTNNPNYNAERGEVKTQFIINVAADAQTKAAAADVQANRSFKGMDQMKLFVTKGYGADYQPIPYQFDLGTLSPVTVFGTPNLNSNGAISVSNSRRVYNMTLPTGVDNMLFYAKVKGTEGTTTTTDETYTIGTNRQSTHFNLKPIADDADFNESGSDGAKLLEILNSFSDYIAAWKATNDPASPTADVTMGTAFTNYYTTSEILRQASGAAVLRTMQDLYNIVAPRAAVATDPCKDLCINIKEKIESYFNHSESAPYTLTYKTTTLLDLDFPESLGLPAGVAQVKCTWTDGTPGNFVWVNGQRNTVIDPTTVESNAIDFTNIMFPPQLMYWADSPIRVSNKEGIEEKADSYPINWTEWNNDNSWKSNYGWLDWSVAANRVITKDTRAVALKNNVLYGTSLAQVTVQLSAASLDDNRKELTNNLADQTINVDGKFTVKGILIGGQPKMVGWNFVADPNDANKPVSADATSAPTYPDFTGVVYDNVTGTPTISKSSASTPFYVSLFDNYNGTNTPDKVYFALELINNTGKDFYGKDNIIFDGGTFYLTGVLNLSAGADGDAQPNMSVLKGYRIPPVKTTNGITETDAGENDDYAAAKRIFIQDFMTTIKITLSNAALKNAYATIPDLRPIQMYFGLSVDLDWKTGATLNVAL